MRLLRWQLAAKPGFSLIETIIATALTVLVVLAVYTFLSTGASIQTVFTSQNDITTTAQQTLNRMAKIIRSATDGDDGSYPVVAAANNTLTIFANIDSDTAVEQIQYALNGTNLIQTVIKPTGNPAQYNPANAIVTNVAYGVVNANLSNQPIFTYYNSNYPTDQTTNPLPTPINLKDIYLIKISLTINAANASGKSSQFETYVQLRNLKNNL